MDLTITELNIVKKSDLKIKDALANFVKKDSAYKNNFLQSRYKTAFDGYSFIGQKDSLNQYDTDMLHSFVLSEFQSIENFPIEFKNFLEKDWGELIKVIKSIELNKVKRLKNPILNQLYKEDAIGYMMSCNYYPKPASHNAIKNTNVRLSAHKDVSLFTTFPYGVDKGLSIYNVENKLIEVNKKDTMILFSGYFAEFVTNNKIMALNHQVNLPKDLDSERYSFAIFSIPKPGITFSVSGKKITSTEYYKKYLSLF